ncbi:TonB-dependent receptor [Parvibaculum sp.]|uniref:TonB-dependent receptor family protein n=1 Tax=Parvibaculum sp. TaxID=2024848 RepID=UPI001DCB16C6|nr:TonB-dependent receptor [Parvibaculum sp.]MBX3489912.1 TonB-dependent receptor [Parvibaculum sp.]MCW5726100.1 TonB-dependent receptor [Parvibaculum sp.]
MRSSFSTAALLRGCSSLALATALLAAPAAMAEESAAETAQAEEGKVHILKGLLVTSTAEETAEVGGGVTFIDKEELEKFSYTDVNRVLRVVPGVQIQEEDGYGLRPNIGIRGSGNDRNNKIVVMEDGVLMAPAPYAAPAAYYFPFTGRMEAIEITKGAAAIKYGPSTVGGAVNMFSTSIPDNADGSLSGTLKVLGGEDNTLRVHGYAGGWMPLSDAWDVGILLETLQDRTDGFKTVDGGGDTGYRVQDYVGKLGFRSKAGSGLRHAFEFKVQVSDEHSDETYLGLTPADFAANPYRRYAASRLDQMNVDHKTFQATHRVDFSNDTNLTTTAYYTDTARAWYKINDVRQTGAPGWTSISAAVMDPANSVERDILRGIVNGDIRVRNNNREYYTAGIQSVLGTTFLTGDVAHFVEVSARYHEDEEDRFQNQDVYNMTGGQLTLAAAGAPGSQENRIGDARAWAFFVRDTIDWGNLTVVPGLRYETIKLRRTDYALNDPARVTPIAVLENSVDVLIPGISATYNLSDEWQLLGGVHRGFAAPGPGSTSDAEKSVNYEAGFRYGAGDFAFEAIGFFNDYSNLLGTCTASTGGGCVVGTQFDGGDVDVKGIEVMAGYDAGGLIGLGLKAPLALAYTYTTSEFKTSFASGFGPWGTVTAGDELPYLPEHMLTLSAGLEGEAWRTNLLVSYVDKTRAVAGRGAIPANQLINERVILDLSAEYDVVPGVTLIGIVENLTDEVYNVSFDPAGARPGKPRTVLGGVKLSF